MTTTDHATCRKCGKPFRPSRTGRTVHCPDCRRRRTATATPTTGPVTCRCGKTVVVDGTGRPTGWTCPRGC